MKPEDKSKVCAELDGWTKNINAHPAYRWQRIDVAGHTTLKPEPPHYLNDLNVIVPLIVKWCGDSQLR